jgi:NADH-quinone oxidoreductase subunit N
VIAVRERETTLGDDITAVQGLGKDRPELAWPLTISMLALAGLPGTAGFMGKLFLIEAAVAGDYTWLGVFIVVGSMISLVYYLRVVAAVWMRPAPRLAPAIAGAAPEAAAEPLPSRTGTPGRTPQGTPSGGRCWLLLGSIVVTSAATIVFGIIPSPLIDFSLHAGRGIASMVGL